jgi:hypothetical protein
MTKRRDKIRTGLTRRVDDGNEENLDDMYTDGADLGDILSGIDQPRDIPKNVLIPAPDGTISYQGYSLTPVGIESLSGMSIDQWQELGNILARFESGIQWLIGDWLAYGEGRSAEWGEKYAEAMAQTGLAYSTCAKYKTISTKVNFFLRRKELTFSHHEVVSALPTDQQEYWLQEAVDQGMSVARLRTTIQRGVEGDKPALVIKRSADTLTRQRERIRLAAIQGNRQAWLQHVQEEIEALRKLYEELEQMAED